MMNGRALMVGKQAVEVFSNKMTWLEAVHKSNVAGKKMMPNSFFSIISTSKDEQGRHKPLPDEISTAVPIFTGTFAVIGAKGKPLGKRLETQCNYEGQAKTVIIETDGAKADVMVCCDHGFASGSPLIPLIDAKTEKAIRNHNEMVKADEVIIRLNGQTYTFEIKGRNGGILEKVNGVDIFSWIDNSAVGSLLWRNGNYFFDISRYVDLTVRISDSFSVITEARKQLR